MSEGVVSLRHVRLLLATMAMEGHDVVSLLAEFDREPADLLHPHGNLPASRFGALWARAAALTGDEGLGVRVAARIDLHLYAIVGHDSDYLLAQLLWLSATVGDGLERLARYHEIYNQALDYEVGWRGSRWWVGLRERQGPLPLAARSFALAWPLQVLRQASGAPLIPAAVSFRGPPAGVEALGAFFGVTPVFGAAEDGLLLRAEQQAWPLRLSDPGRVAATEARAQELQAALGEELSFVGRAQRAIAGGPGAPRRPAEVARQLGVAVRTLTRRLEAEGTSYRALVDAWRSQRSAVLLRERPVEEVALMLGFSDERAFRRAFQRWYGATPVAWLRGVEEVIRRADSMERPDGAPRVGS